MQQKWHGIHRHQRDEKQEMKIKNELHGLNIRGNQYNITCGIHLWNTKKSRKLSF